MDSQELITAINGMMPEACLLVDSVRSFIRLYRDDPDTIKELANTICTNHPGLAFDIAEGLYYAGIDGTGFRPGACQNGNSSALSRWTTLVVTVWSR